MKKAYAWPTVVDLYCGCGGVTEGLKKARFRVVAAVDNDPVACKTYKKNHPTVHLYENDIGTINPKKILEDDLGGQDLDILVVCAPCQPFSSQNQQQKNDGRERLILEAVRFAKVLKPKVIFFENVPGLNRHRFAPLMGELKNGLKKVGYHLGNPELIDAADYGVPQRRLRCVMFAKRRGLPPSPPGPITPEGRRITVEQVIRDLPDLKSGESCHADPLHCAREHQSIALERLAHIPIDGGSRDSLPLRLQLACHKKPNSYPDVYGRMRWNDVAPTLTTGCTDITRGRFAHPENDRAISLREAARLQTFPDNYVFLGSYKQIGTQIGNAVPVRLIKSLAPTLRLALKS